MVCMRRTVCAAILLAGCGSGDEVTGGGTRLRMDFGDTASFFASPFPSDHRLVDGVVDMSAYPNPDGIPFVESMLAVVDGKADGFGQSSGIFLSATAAIDESTLPSLSDSVTPEASVYLIGIDAASPDYGQRYPVTVKFTADAGPFGEANLLSVVPFQGVPLLPRTRYAVMVSNRVRDVSGDALASNMDTIDSLSGAAAETYQLARDAVDDSVMAMAAFTTSDATEGMSALLAHAKTLPMPAPLSAWSQTDMFDEYCVYQTTLNMPVYQQGEPPYQDVGGGIEVDDSGDPVYDRDEEARVVVTVPRSVMPAGGWPTAVMVRTGGGGDRPLVDRGVRDEDGNVAIPGSGPALHFTRAGFAGVSVDGPHGGIRNVSGGDEQFLIFNIGNAAAMRDNIRQSALELALLVDVIDTFSVDASDCPGADASIAFDISTLAIMGHSMGATISPLTLAVEPRYRAVILSGAGGSWIENVMHKQSPVAVRPLAELLLYYPTHGRKLHAHDPVLSLLQWAGEAADPPLYAREIMHSGDPRNVLMLQGIVDTYILPPIANATSVSFGLDLAGVALDVDDPGLSEFLALEQVLAFGGGELSALPVSGNRDDATAVVVQHAQGPVEDGHEVAFQTEAPKHQYRCFLDSLRSGTPIVDASAAEDAPCP
jgi:hypothetical protein